MLQSAPPHLRHFIVHLENTMWCTSTPKDRRSLHGCRRCLGKLLYHPILQVVILRKSNRDASTAIHWENKDKICSSFSSRAFSGVIFEAMNWKWSCRYQCRGICRGEENAKFLIFELDESRILIRKNQYEQIEDRSMNLKCRLYRSKWVQSIAASDVMESGQVVENPMIGAIPSRNEVQRELDDLLMSM